MINVLFSNPLAFLIVFPGLLMTITIHEFAHCWTADQLGDPTPRAKGRLTLDPRVHLDPLGVLAILLTNFGWGKPAPFDPYNLKNPIKDSALIAASGAVSNLIVATGLAILLRVITIPFSWVQFALLQLVVVNVYLALFNLIPVKPLDGSKVLVALLPKQAAHEYSRFMNRYGLMILILLLIPFGGGRAPIDQLLSPIFNLIFNILL